MHTCYIVGAAPQAVRIAPQTGDFIIAADGGLHHLQAWGVQVDRLVGDMDSLGELPLGIPFKRYPAEKDDTDLALALELGLQAGYTRFIFSGCTGGRADHMFANVQLLVQAAKHGVQATMLDEDYTLTALAGPGELKLEGHGTVSVFAYGDCAQSVTITGMKYNIAGETLQGDVPRGISNELNGQGTVALEHGVLLVYQYKEQQS
ncbi:MAG: thiamine diphosphokinase [Oscillospiraceae bacterium]|jgi:thiamine pyrophosphokinase|nr:thiamine diphosphokinase [Oscillospiraceae bacterium]